MDASPYQVVLKGVLAINKLFLTKYLKGHTFVFEHSLKNSTIRIISNRFIHPEECIASVGKSSVIMKFNH